MPSLVEIMQPWTHMPSFTAGNLLRRSCSSSSATSSTPLASSPLTSSLLSGGGSGSTSGSSDTMAKTKGGSSCKNNSSTRGGGGTGSGGLFGKFCSGSSSKNSKTNSSSSKSGSSCSKANSVNSASCSNNSNDNLCNGSRPKRKTPILSACMNNWVKFDHDCQKPLHCTECESNQERNRKVLFTSGGNVLISTGSMKGRNHHHRHSQNFFGGSNSHTHHNHHQANGMSLSEPSSPTDCVVRSIGDSHHDGEVVCWENEKSSLKIVINVPCLDMNLFQNENIQVEIVCNDKNKKLGTGKYFETVERSQAELKASGWYYEKIDSEASMGILESTRPGAFIVRDSSDPRFLYSLSIQTERGPTSVRLPYKNGKFSLDGDEKLGDKVPKFDSVIGLIEHYVYGGTKIGKQVSVWIDHEGNMHSTVKLSKPVRKDVGSLKHLARVAINRQNLLINNNNNITTPGSTNTSTSSSANCSASTSSKKVTSTNNFIPSPPSDGFVTSSSENTTTTPTSENNIITSSSNAPVADLSRLPMSLQNYLVEYPYKL